MHRTNLFIKPMDDININELDRFIMEAFEDVKYDNELIILKGHILIEFAINLAIEKLAFAGAKEIHKLNFYQKLLFARAMGVFEGGEGLKIFEQIRIVSKMRNEIAHKLSLNEKQGHQLLKDYPTLSDNATSPVKIHLAINFIILYHCTFILCRLKTKIDVNSFSYEMLNDHVIEKHIYAEKVILQKHLEAMESTIASAG